MLELLAGNRLLKGGVILAIAWWLWFKDDERQPVHRQHIILTFVGCIIGMIAARVLSMGLPFRLRPIHDESSGFVLPYGVSPAVLDGWSSFPSDHAVLFFALSAGLLFISRKAGIIALLYTALVISFPRVYLGMHYPTDILAGAAIGILIALLANIYLMRVERLKAVANWSYSSPGVFYPFLFLFSYQVADMFDNSRALLRAGLKLVQAAAN
ncbi:MAG: phosphatase PAP2 family protein [Candidatus Competibacter sp.]|nr:phosphatase PAP2 family protein [Candidatus Competibacter sp.]